MKRDAVAIAYHLILRYLRTKKKYVWHPTLEAHKVDEVIEMLQDQAKITYDQGYYTIEAI